MLEGIDARRRDCAPQTPSDPASPLGAGDPPASTGLGSRRRRVPWQRRCGPANAPL